MHWLSHYALRYIIFSSSTPISLPVQGPRPEVGYSSYILHTNWVWFYEYLCIVGIFVVSSSSCCGGPSWWWCAVLCAVSVVCVSAALAGFIFHFVLFDSSYDVHHFMIYNWYEVDSSTRCFPSTRCRTDFPTVRRSKPRTVKCFRCYRRLFVEMFADYFYY